VIGRRLLICLYIADFDKQWYKNHINLKQDFFDFCLFAESSGLEKLVKENPSSNFLIDEAPVSDKGFPTKTLAEMSGKISLNQYLWVACQSDKTPSTHDSNLGGNYFKFNYNKLKFSQL
jgi:hypothetical protein